MIAEALAHVGIWLPLTVVACIIGVSVYRKLANR